MPASWGAEVFGKSFTLDGEAVVTDEEGVAVFDALHRRHKAADAMLYAFDLLELNGKDLRPLPLGDRKAKLARLLARAPAGIVFNEHTDEDGAVVFRGLDAPTSSEALHAVLRGIRRTVGVAPVRKAPATANAIGAMTTAGLSALAQAELVRAGAVDWRSRCTAPVY